jgi:hypothetical protein
MLTTAILRSLILTVIGLSGIILGERRWRSVDRARSALRTGKFSLYLSKESDLWPWA